MKTLKLMLFVFIAQIVFVSGLYASSISGKVTDAVTGKPIEGARVVAKYADHPEVSVAFGAKTNATGDYKIERIPNGNFILSAAAEGYLIADLPGTYTLNDNDLAGVDFKMTPLENATASLSGFVKEFVIDTTSGKDLSTPIYPATITANGVTVTGDSVSYSTVNSKDGSYLINNMKPGVYKIISEAEGYNKKNISGVKIIQGSNSLNIYMTKAYGSSISGRVTFDGSGLPVPGAQIGIFPAEGNGWAIMVTTDKQGYYKTTLDEGKYIVSCTKISLGYFYSEYYDNVKSQAEAKVLTVGANTELTDINFGLPQNNTQINTVIKGTVKDDKGNAIAGAVVKVWFHYMYDSPRFAPLDSLLRFIATKSDAQGNYSVNLNMAALILNRVAVSAEKDGYVTEFYNNKTSFFEADLITITKDTTISGIDFSLSPVNTQNYFSISGTVSGTAGKPLSGAFVIGATSRSSEIVFAITDKDGKYSLTNLKEGKYYLLFAAQGYIPEFYNNAYRWEDADAIYLSGNVTGINAELRETPTDSGKCHISGIVKNTKGSIISGALVILKNSKNEAVASAITDGQGSYQMAGLPEGNYTLTVSSVEYQSATSTVSVDASKSEQVANVSLTQSTTGVNNDRKMIPTEIKLVGNYPNPFNPSTMISFMLPTQQFVTLKVYNLLGQQVATLVNEKLDAGEYKFSFSAGHLSSGVYLYELRAGNYTSVKKMVLAK
ncbi:MAG: carboxypeptidase regulatory-like domain-containing protein [Bacteroidota bacterium]|nr:carboxypeptidase regulatory-like domain-containing protein [Bacteroidota bacterium]MDP4195226.1 carboxypeptidase regulatory-like domain-containing protein [Bacteroidota bacterium]